MHTAHVVWKFDGNFNTQKNNNNNNSINNNKKAYTIPCEKC